MKEQKQTMKSPKYVISLDKDKLSSYSINMCYLFIIDEVETVKYSDAYADRLNDLVEVWYKVIERKPENYQIARAKDSSIVIEIMSSLVGDLKVDENKYMSAKLIIEQLRRIGAVSPVNQLEEFLTELSNTWDNYSFETE